MKYKAIAYGLVLASLVGCTSTGSRVERFPLIDQPSQASIGDPIYRFSAVDRLTIDHYSGVEYGGDGQTKELLYSGVSNGQLRLTYREFEAQAKGSKTSNFARPAFSQDVQYDYSGGEAEINFQTVRIEVLSADAQQISYTIKNGFRGESEIEAAALCSDAKWKDPDSSC